MDEIKTNKIFWVVLAVTILNIAVFLIGRVIIDKSADRVIERLQKDYSPSPYGPGFDPDKLGGTGFKMSANEISNELELMDQRLSESSIVAVDLWRDDWEKERGFIHEQ
jgi:hypothetical protein